MPPGAGRWSGMPPTLATSDARALAFADQLLLRWGVIFRDLLARETLAPPWRDLLPVLRRKEAQGEIRGGRFVSGFTGEQFARPEALDLLRAVRRSETSEDENVSNPQLRSAEPGRHHSARPPRQHAAAHPAVLLQQRQRIDIDHQRRRAHFRCCAKRRKSRSVSFRRLRSTALIRS